MFAWVICVVVGPAAGEADGCTGRGGGRGGALLAAGDRPGRVACAADRRHLQDLGADGDVEIRRGESAVARDGDGGLRT